MNIVGKNVNKYRTALNLSLEGLGKLARWDKTNLKKLEDTGSGYTHNSISRLAAALNVRLSALFDETGAFEFARFVPIDVYTPEMIQRDAAGHTSIQPPAHQRGGISNVVITDGSFTGDAFAFFVDDEAMRPDLSTGDMVIVEPKLKAEPNDLVVAVIYRRSTRKSQTVVRRFAERSAGFELLPNDIAYSPEIPIDDNIGLIGTVVEQRKKRRR